MKKTLVVLALATLTSTAFAGEIYTGVGTDGLALGYTQSISAFMGARIEGNILSVSHDVNTDRVHYNGTVKANTVGLFYDFFPFGNSLRISSGAVIGERRLNVDAASSQVMVNGRTYSTAGQSLSGSAKFPSVSPYVGIGYGHQAATKGLGVYFDIGVTYGHPSVNLSASPALLAVAGQANVDAERQQLQDKADKFRFYPIVKLGLGYTF